RGDRPGRRKWSGDGSDGQHRRRRPAESQAVREVVTGTLARPCPCRAGAVVRDAVSGVGGVDDERGAAARSREIARDFDPVPLARSLQIAPVLERAGETGPRLATEVRPESCDREKSGT